ncbi:Ldh family oxidoreductase [Solidesulfovibrio sp.]|uniref:Ldh family oxidoreductase n=1 Tax=Solidesulfovibrio sp. TaxID=2910990 RepID=UPI0026226624|nr:Ldh family oxidoreductase [Solidesulfovibrio sp.]
MPYPLRLLSEAGQAVLTAHGVPSVAAASVMDVLVAAEARGFSSHGLLRLPRIVAGIVSGAIVPAAEPSIDFASRCCLRVNGRQAPGPYAARLTMNAVVSWAKTDGLCLASASGMSHFGFGGYYADMAAAEGLVGLVLCNTQPAAGPFGGQSKVLGTNPISFSCPTGEPGGVPLSLDMATTAAARGLLLSHKLRSEPLPPDIAAGPDGGMTTDPDEALAGFLLPLGGAFGFKGTGLALMVDILSGALSGAATGLRVKGTLDAETPCTAGFLFLALDPAFFCGRERFLAEVDRLVADMRGAGPDVRLPGERGHARAKRAAREGVELPQALVARLRALEAEAGVCVLSRSGDAS